MRNLRLMLVAGILLGAVACGGGGSRSEPTACASDYHLRFEPSGEAFDLCQPSVTLEGLEYGWHVGAEGKLPADWPLGTGVEPATFGLNFELYGQNPRGRVYITGGGDMEPAGPWLQKEQEGNYSWEAECPVRMDEAAGRMAFTCELGRTTYSTGSWSSPEQGGYGQVIGDLPLPENLPSPSLVATYRITGAYEAEGTVGVIVPPGLAALPENNQILSLLLEDGSLVMLRPGGFVYVRLYPASWAQWDENLSRGVADFGVCRFDLDAVTWAGTVSCTGEPPVSDPSSPLPPATLDLTLESVIR